MSKDRVSIGITVKRKNYEAYKKYCDEHGIKYNYLIDKFMEEAKYDE